MAADSRGIARNVSGDSPPDDSFCKIAEFGHQIVFTSVGTFAHPSLLGDLVQGWTNIEVAETAIATAEMQPGEGQELLRNIAVRWANSLVSNFNSYYLWHSDDVVRLAELGKGTLTGGIFAYANKGIIYSQVALITFNKNRLLPIVALFGEIGDIDDCQPCGEGEGGKICSAGEVSIPNEFCSKGSPRAVREAEQWAKAHLKTDPGKTSTQLAVRLAELSVEYDPTGTVGGKIDTIELWKDGTVRWVARKENCPENRD